MCTMHGRFIHLTEYILNEPTLCFIWPITHALFENTLYISINAHKYIKISLYMQWTPTCFGQPCGHLQGYKMQSFHTLASHKSIPSSVFRGIVDSYSTLPWVTWEAIAVMEGTPWWGLLRHRLVNGALVYPSQGGRYRAEGCMALG